MSSPEIKVAVVGCGVFGRHHARNYCQIPGARLVGVYDPDPARAQALAAEFETQVFASLDELSGAAQAATIAAPTGVHAAVALPLLEAGVDLLIEKPLAGSLEQADTIIAAAARYGRVLQVGHLERFNPSVQLVRPRITRPLFFEVHRLSVFSPRSLDVDVLLDLMIHDLDLVHSFVNDEVQDIQAVGLPILSSKVDIANVRVTFQRGCVANFTASRVSTEKVRKMRFFQPGEYVSLDYTRQDALIFQLGKPERSPMPQINKVHLTSPPVEPLRAELEAFLHSVRTRDEPEVSGAQARRALATALRAATAIHLHLAGLGIEKNLRPSG